MNRFLRSETDHYLHGSSLGSPFFEEALIRVILGHGASRAVSLCALIEEVTVEALIKNSIDHPEAKQHLIVLLAPNREAFESTEQFMPL